MYAGKQTAKNTLLPAPSPNFSDVYGFLLVKLHLATSDKLEHISYTLLDGSKACALTVNYVAGQKEIQKQTAAQTKSTLSSFCYAS